MEAKQTPMHLISCLSFPIVLLRIWEFLGPGNWDRPQRHGVPFHTDEPAEDTSLQPLETNRMLRALPLLGATPPPPAVPRAEAAAGCPYAPQPHGSQLQAKPQAPHLTDPCQVQDRGGYHTFCNYSQHSGRPSTAHQRGTSSYWGRHGGKTQTERKGNKGGIIRF